jgi:DNA-binding response OmpR family regulator
MPRILLIDDDDQLRGLLKAIMEGVGYVVDTASDGAQGVKKFRQNRADLAIVDIFMPEKEGLETIVELKQIDPNVKAIAISGGGLTMDMEFLDHAKTFGADHTMEKPLDPQELLNMVHQMVGGKL